MLFNAPFARSAAEFATRYRRRIVAGAAAVLVGGTAVSFAVAPLAPDAADLPQRTVVEPVQPLELAPQLEALAAHDLLLSRSEVTRQGDSLESVLRRLDVRDASASAALRREATLRRQVEGRKGRIVQSRVDAQGRLVDLTVLFPAESADQARSHFTRLVAERKGARFALRSETQALSRQMRLASGTIRSNLFAATDDAGIPDAVATQMAEIFSSDIDLHRELRKGDTFSVVYEAVTANGEPVPWSRGHGRVLAAEFVTSGRTYQAIWFEKGGRGGYFDPSGRSRKRTFLATPVEFSRITSGFAMRMHPILQRMQAHQGVDYAAPTGTPVRVVGDGVVDFAGWQSGYGNVVIVHHANDRTTLYAHLSRIDVRKGQRVAQGTHIGAVGATGWATGPHLHFEFRVGGVHLDPLRIARETETVTLDAGTRPQFAELAQRVREKLDAAASVGGAPTFE